MSQKYPERASQRRSANRTRIESYESMILMSATAVEVEIDQITTPSDGNDLLVQFVAEDRLAGESGDDVLLAAAGGNAIDGGAGDDLLIPVRGDNLITGGEGVDRVIYLQGTRADYVASDLGFGMIEITSGDRADVLFGVETVVFADGAVDVALLTTDASPSSGKPAANAGPAADIQAEDLFGAAEGSNLLLTQAPGQFLTGSD